MVDSSGSRSIQSFGQAGSPYETTFYVYYSSYCPTTFNGQEYVNDVSNCNPGYPTLVDRRLLQYLAALVSLRRGTGMQERARGAGDATTEVPLFNIRLYNGSHRGGGPVFGRNADGSFDGYMYVAVGDQFRYTTAQDISGNFEGGTMRIAVDVTDNGDGTWTCPAGSHQPIPSNARSHR